ncbi:mucin-5AC [Bombyx mandarina]|uniref:Mucin-5AC n=1 Tax=Bombyx mandarina TaxID=7092 RepID=A0A6J2KD42_BOMMA|nr:mucin-5AC [Bombyx mandarina]
MIRSKGDMASPRFSTVLLAAFHLFTVCWGGPVGPLPNVTSVDLGLKEGSCALGDVVYLPGDEFPGSDPCEKCKCSDGGGVQCEKQQCESRPGCKAVHRPDHCCPTYQCDCEQEGRVYDNGEKLVDPADPCRVCYCQGGEVVCRRIACFVRDDCTPRLVPGRCCPEYDNCPVRGVTMLPGVSSLPPNLSPTEDIKGSAAPTAPKENLKQEFTIKEITPVSEIPIMNDVKIKKILPFPSIDVAEYSSSKSPPITREATSEISVKTESEIVKTDAPTITEVHQKESDKKPDDTQPSKISFSTQDSINSDIYSSNESTVTNGLPTAPSVTTTKAPIIEEEDTSLFDHNPAFPPIPDDLAVLSNHGDEIVPEPSAEGDHMTVHDTVPSLPSIEPKLEEPIEPKEISDIILTTEKPSVTSIETSTTAKQESTTVVEQLKESPMLNLRSAIPTEILNAPSLVPADTGEPLDDGITTDVPEISSTTEETETSKESSNHTIEVSETPVIESFATTTGAELDTTTPKVSTEHEIEVTTKDLEQTTSSIAKSNSATEVTSHTEISSLPIETSDQNPHESEAVVKDKIVDSTIDPFATSAKVSPSEVITVSRAVSNEDNVFENVETTEFILTSFGSSETATDSVELIKISGDPEKSAQIVVEPEEKRNSVLADLINLVSDVATINDHTENPNKEQAPKPTSISDSEELIPVNAGYKSKNSNYNQNSITEIPYKSKNTPGNRQKVVEIEDDESESITDLPAPHDKVEPTTRRPIIDNVSDKKMENKTQEKDTEIITQSYVPTINRRPIKVIMKKNNDRPVTESPEGSLVSVSSEAFTDDITDTTENSVAAEEKKRTEDSTETVLVTEAQ